MMAVGETYAVIERMPASTNCEWAPATSTVREMEYLGLGSDGLRMTYPAMVPIKPAESGLDIFHGRVQWTPGFRYVTVRLSDVMGIFRHWRVWQVDVWADAKKAA